MHLKTFIGALTLATLTAGLVQSAAAQSVGSVEIVKAEARMFQKLTQDPSQTASRGFVQMVTAPAGQAFLVVWLDLKLKPGKDEGGDEIVRIVEKEVGLVGSDGAIVSAVGRCTRDGRFFTDAGSYSYYGRPETETTPLDLVYIVPAQARTFELKLGKAAQSLKVTEPVAPTIPRSAIAQFQVQNVGVINKVVGEQRLGSYEQEQGVGQTQVESLSERYAVVKLLVRPNARNADSGFQITTTDIGALYGAQVYAAPIGYVEYDTFTPHLNTYYSQMDAAGDLPAIAATLVFPLPGKITKFKLLYLLEPVAEVAISP